jgi:hypothetical protein
MAHEVLQNAIDEVRRLEGCDAVMHPDHYTRGSIQCIDVREQLAADGADFRVLHAIEYLWRSHNKHGLEDLKKARWYIDRKIAELEAA